jgi:hypothetical protein
VAIDLKKALQKKLAPKQGADSFKFETIGDQLIFKFVARRTEKIEGRDSELVDANILAGEKFDPKSKKMLPVKPGQGVFFLGTHLRRVFDTEKPSPGDMIQLQLAEIRADKRNMKMFGFDFLERVDAPKSPPDTDDVRW